MIYIRYSILKQISNNKVIDKNIQVKSIILVSLIDVQEQPTKCLGAYKVGK